MFVLNLFAAIVQRGEDCWAHCATARRMDGAISLRLQGRENDGSRTDDYSEVRLC
jgi:hypothetical protein